MNTIAFARSIVEGIVLGGTHATLDPVEAIAAVQAGEAVVLVTPPKVSYPTYHQAEAEWTLYAVPGLATRAETWDAIDDIVEQLRVVLDVDEVRPYDWQPDNGAPMVAAEITVTTHHDT